MKTTNVRYFPYAEGDEVQVIVVDEYEDEPNIYRAVTANGREAEGCTVTDAVDNLYEGRTI